MVVALLQRGEVSLTRWLPYVPCRGVQAQSKQRRLSRWLHNSRLNIHRLYKPLIQAALAGWDEDCLYLSLDTSLFWDEYCLIRLAVVHRGLHDPRVRQLPGAPDRWTGVVQAMSGCTAAGFLATGRMKLLTEVLQDRRWQHEDRKRQLA